jgi:hypothetical protein
VTYSQRRGRRWSTYSAFLKPILNRRSLTIMKFAYASKVNLPGFICYREIFFCVICICIILIGNIECVRYCSGDLIMRLMVLNTKGTVEGDRLLQRKKLF